MIKIVTTNYMGQAENKPQLEILKYLLSKGHLAWRNNNGALWDSKLNAYRSNPYTPKGLPDILLIDREEYGQLVGLEVKTTKGRPSASQLLVQKRFRLNNARYEFVTSIQDVKALGL